MFQIYFPQHLYFSSSTRPTITQGPIKSQYRHTLLETFIITFFCLASCPLPLGFLTLVGKLLGGSHDKSNVLTQSVNEIGKVSIPEMLSHHFNAVTAKWVRKYFSLQYTNLFNQRNLTKLVLSVQTNLLYSAFGVAEEVSNYLFVFERCFQTYFSFLMDRIHLS